MASTPFESLHALRTAFADGLARLVAAEPGLGPFILALNNAAFDRALMHQLAAGLESRFAALSDECRAALRHGRDPVGPRDDLEVFLRLMAIGLDGLPPVRHRHAGPWELQFNPLRGLRPARAAGGQPQSNRAPFDSNGFHFNKPFLRREAFWEGELAGVEVELLYNKFPFVDLHALLVPRRLNNSPQYLQQRDHESAWAMTEALAPTLPGVGLAFNSFGAFASVNHLHFQLFVRAVPLPLADPGWRHNGGDRAYPVACRVFGEPGAAWDWLSMLNADGHSYNLVYTPGRLYCLPRRRQGSYVLPEWCGGQAWYELAGGAVILAGDLFDVLAAEDVARAMAAANLPDFAAGVAGDLRV